MKSNQISMWTIVIWIRKNLNWFWAKIPRLTFYDVSSKKGKDYVQIRNKSRQKKTRNQGRGWLPIQI